MTINTVKIMDTNFKIAVCADEQNTESIVSDRFARCNYYCVYDHEILDFSFIENLAKEEMSGAGVKAAKMISALGVKAILVPEVGPKAWDALEAFEIEVYKYNNKEYTVRDAVYEYYEKRLPKLFSSSRRGKHA